jgi:hypothetical protein
MEGGEMADTIKPISLDMYIHTLQGIAVVQKVEVLYDDRPDTVSIRMEYLANVSNMDVDLIDEARQQVSWVVKHARIENCREIHLTSVVKEVII